MKKPRYRDIDRKTVDGILARAKASPLSETDHTTLTQILDTFSLMTAELQKNRTSIARLRALLFGAQTEKTDKVLGSLPPKGDSAEAKSADKPSPPPAKKPPRAPGKGHGRNGADDYAGAPRVTVPHPELKSKDLCPECEKGRVYPMRPPAVLVRITGVAPLAATVYEREKLRCNLCGAIFTAPAPAGMGDEKYDAGAIALNALMKYGLGLPFNRIEKLQRALGIPLPASTQWDLVADGGESLAPVYRALIRQGAQGQVLHNDDTTIKIRELKQAREDADEGRTGLFTTGIVALSNDHQIALFFSGRQHAGENLADVLAQREADLPAPIQMCDALSRNLPKDFETILALCNAHARRKFVEVADHFPDECRFVLEIFREVYRIDAKTKDLSADDRLRCHQEYSQPLLEQLQAWMQEQIDKHWVEPNSGLGQAIRYTQKHWSGLTQFLRTPGAPLDNNITERLLKKAILHRKNALFYQTQAGARIGDMWMTVIHTTELNGITTFPYLTALLRHRKAIEATPAAWLPWNYHTALAALEPAKPPPDPPE